MPLPLPRPCIVCQRLTEPGESRCKSHLAMVEVLKRERRQSSPGDGAQRRLRQALNREGIYVLLSNGVRI